MRRGWVLLLLVLLCGCPRAWYRLDADKETYGIINERRNPAVWPVANTSVTPPPASRLYDPFNPDYPPMPPDDPAADQYMRRVNGMRNSKHFHDDGDAPFIEDPDWLHGLELDKDGKLVLTPDRAVELGVLNSREYQNQLDLLYLDALALTLNRFDFQAHWFLTNLTMFDHFGSSDTEVNTLTTNTDFGFTRNFAAGGQLLFDIANSFVFTFSGVNHTTTTTNIGITLIQPLLRGFGRRVRLEQLTEGERMVLYAVRAFARFRKVFYVNLTTQAGSGYLSLLLQLQNTRNLEADLQSQEKNLLINQAQQDAGAVSIVQVDQAFQSYQSAKLNLLSAQTALQNSLDQYKLTLGLPPGLPVRIDDDLLRPFQLADPDLEKLQGELDSLWAEYREMDVAPPVSNLHDGYVRLRVVHTRLLKLLDGLHGELARWKANLGKGAENEDQARRERATFENLSQRLPALRADLNDVQAAFDKSAKYLDEKPQKLDGAPPPVGAAIGVSTFFGLAEMRKPDWKRLEEHLRQEDARAADLFVLQTLIRVHLIELKPIPATLDEASTYARENRLDLMNERGRVVDAWRQAAVTADALRAGLTVTAKANVTTPPGGTNPVDFRASASDYNIGFAFDSPLNRMAERNAYRTAQINYERERRNFMALDDQIQAAIRQDLRTLETERASFAIARQSLISAARLVESSRDSLLFADKGQGTTVGLDVLNALTSLLNSKQTLISSWISYETTRTQLLLDMEALQVDERGIATDERDHRPDCQPAELPALPPGVPGFGADAGGGRRADRESPYAKIPTPR
jgi:outer membrane protein TolC